MSNVKDLLAALASRGIRLSASEGQLMCYAPRESLTGELRTAIARHKSELIALLSRGQQSGVALLDTPAPAVVGTEEGSVLPLSLGAQGLYVYQKMSPESAIYNVPVCLELTGEIDMPMLRRAWEAVLDRFPILMTRVIEGEDVPALVLDRACKATVADIAQDRADRDTAIRRLLEASSRPFDLNRGPLVRIELHRLGGGTSFLLIVAHHMIFDGHSGILLLKSLLEAYRGLLSTGKVEFLLPSTGYSEYVAWEQSMLVSSEAKKHADFWRERAGRAASRSGLADLVPESDRHQGADESFSLTHLVDADLSRRIRRLSHDAGVTLSAFFLAAFACLLRRYTAEDDVAVVMPVSQRQGGNYSGDVGYFVNILPIHLDFGDASEGFIDFAARVQRILLDALYHSAYPYPLIRHLSSDTEDRIAPSIGIGYAYQDFLSRNAFDDVSGGPGPRVKTVEDIHQQDDSEFGLQVFDGEDAFALKMSCDPRLYGETFLPDFVARFERFLETLADTGGDASRFTLVSPAERRRQLLDFNPVATTLPPHDICALFKEAADRHADNIAIVSAAGGMRYRDVDEKSDRAADALRRALGGEGGIVGLCVERSAEAIVGMLAILRAGGCFLPLDPAYPDERLAHMLRDSGARLLIVDAASMRRIASIVGDDLALIAVDALFDAPSTSTSTPAAAPGLAAIDGRIAQAGPACLIYTSGSTGQPKGVLIGHAGLVNHNRFARDFYGITAADAQLQCSSMSFDLFLEEVLTVLTSGGKLVVASGKEALSLQRLATLVDEHALTALNLPTAHFHEIASSGLHFASLRKVIVGGERLDPARARRFLERNPLATLYNTYGPTETTIISTATKVTLESLGAHAAITIGAPIANTQVYIVDQNRDLQPIGIPGEICIAGAGVSQGYLGRPEMTRERFVDNPFEPGARMYLTGDKGRWLDDGNIEYLGRIDHQVKIRGFRVEPGEVESVLGQHPGVDRVVVVAQGEASAKRLVAFHTGKPSGEAAEPTPSADALRDFLSARLPKHLVPSFFVRMESIPLTPNGKIDRRMLERMETMPEPGRPKGAASTATERRLVDVWADVLSIPASAIGVQDDFFHLGGHSLLATRVLSRIKQAFGVDMPIKTLFERPRLAELAEAIDLACVIDIPTIRPVPRQPRMPLSYAQERLWLLHRMEPGDVSYNVPGAVRMRGPLDIDRLEQAFRQVIQRHESLRTVFLEEDGVPFQRILPEVAFSLSRFDLSSAPVASREPNAASLCRAEATAPFDLEQGPLIRARLITLAEDDHLLMVNMHHIVSDGWSIGIFIDEIGHHLAGHDAELPPLPIQYADFSVWQRDWLEGSGELKRQLAYWTETLADSPELLELPTDFPRPGVLSHAGETSRFTLDAQTARGLRQLAEGERCTLFMVLMAAVNALLHRYTGQEDLCIGTPIAGRNDASTERLIGMFVNTLAIRTKLHGEMTFAELLERVKRNCLAAYDHQDAPFEKVIEVLRPKRNMAITPIFQVMVMLQNADAGAAERDIRLHPIESGISKFDLSVEFEETADGLAVAIEYSTALFKHDRIARMVEHLQRLCDAVAIDPSVRLQDIEVLGIERQDTPAADAAAAAAGHWDSLPWSGAAGALPTLRSTPPKPDADRDMRVHAVPLDAALTRDVRASARAMGVTADSVWLAGYAALLRFLGGTPQVRCGVVQADPGHALPLVLDIGDEATGTALIVEVDRQLQYMRDVAGEPPSAIEARMRDRFEGAMFDTLFEIVRDSPVAQGGDAAFGSPFLFRLVERVADGGAVGAPDHALQIGYDANLYDPQSVDDWAAVFATCLQTVLARSDAPWRALPLLPATLRERITDVWNATDHAFSSDVGLTDLLVAQAARTPDAVALVFGDVSLTYRELDARTNRLARHLRALGIDREQVIGVCMHRSVEMVVALHAVVKAGAAYAPLDPDLPAQRLSGMIQEVDAGLVLTQGALEAGVLAGIETPVRLLSLDAGTDPAAAESDAPAIGNAGPRDLAYVIFTSGSTGKPKAAMNEHAPVINRIEWMQDAYPLHPGDRVLQKTPFAFDVSVWEFFWPFMVGATLVVAEPGGHRDPQYLGRIIRECGITTLHFVPSMLQVFVDAGELPSCTTLRRVFASGEALPAPLAARFLAESGAELHNLYGPTEAAIDVSYFHVADRAIASVPIGRPIWNARLYVLDPHGRLLPPGVAGELFIGGLVVGRGYYGRVELTAERFVDSPFVAGERMYRTGDLARWRNDGNIEYLGRIDHQVKIRGFRVELGEVEGALAQHPALDQVVVVAQGDLSAKRLVAFYTARAHRTEEGAAPTANALREFLAAILPEYVIPSFFCRLASIPLSSNGKADRRVLEGMDAKPVSGTASDTPRTATAQTLAAIWGDVLGLTPDAIDGEDDFFHLGGHSLLATRVLSRIKQAFTVDMPLKALFEHPRLAALAQAIDEACIMEIPAIRPAPRQPRMPLSYAQERIWVLHRMEPDDVSYNVPGAVRMRGPLDIDRLEQAFRQVIQRHESLRTVFLEEDGVPFQRILPEVAFSLSRFDLSSAPVASREPNAASLCRAEATAPFDLEQGPLIRARLITLAEDDHLLMVNMHHIVSDGWSIGIFIDEIGHHLAGHDAELPPLPIQYADFSVWQRDWLEGSGELKRQLAYWTETLADSPELLELPTDFPRPGVLSHAGETSRFTLDAQTARGLRQLAEGERCTLFMVLMAAVNALLHRYTGQEDLCIGTPIAGRNDASTERLIGMFVNTLAIRTKLHGEMTFAELLERVKRNCLAAYDHQDAPFEKVIEVLRPKRNMAITPIFQVMVMLQNADAGAAERDIRLHPIESGISKFDLSVEFEETADGLAVAIEYSTALFKHDRIARMVEHLQRLCDAVAIDPSVRLQDIDVLGTERERLQHFHRGPAVPGSEEDARTFMVHRWFEAQAARTPDAVAAEAGDARISYEDLNRRANRIAHGLVAAGVGVDERVAICMTRGLDMVAGMLGILKAGAAYVPLEPGYPAARLAYLLEDSAPKALLTQRELLESDVASQARAQGVVIHAVNGDDFQDRPDHDPDVAVGPRHLAYVIYTSGSTGKPKGVMIEHAGLTHYLRWAVRAYADGGRACDSIVSSPIAFDATVTSVYLPLLTGGRAVLLQAGEEIAGLEALLRSGRRWDLLKITPLHWRELGLRLAAEGVRCDVGAFVVGGEAMPYSAVRIWREVAPAARCINEYGPTETVVGCTIYEVPPGEHDFVDVPIGRPIDNTRIYILDDRRRLQPIGVPGELYIAGDGVARGYLDRPDLTAERFVDDPFVPGARMYRSGDLARWSETGVLEYLGRIDTQVKVRGFRIELGEIEAALCRHPRIDSAMVVTQGAQSDRRLVAFYTLAAQAGAGEAGAGEEPPSQEALKAFLHQSLPEYMVPTAFRTLDAIPQTPSGKLDRPALERMQVDMASTRPYVAPRNEVERELLAIWSEVLQRPADAIGMDDDFFELGGHSLLAVRIITRVKQRSGKQAPLSWLIRAPTIARFAALWTSEDSAAPDDIVVPIAAGGASPAIFAVPGAGGNVMSMTDVSRAIGPERAFYGLQAIGLDGRTPPLESVEATAKANILAMKSVQARGPYHLLGHSYGGVVAYEMARQLAAAGERVGWLVLLDAAVPRLVHEPDATGDEDDARLLGEVIAGLVRSPDASSPRHAGPIDVEAAIGVLRSEGIALDRAQVDALLAVLKANLRCYRRYRPEPMPIDLPVHLYRAIRESGRDWPEDHGWSAFLPTPPSLHAVDADHFSMLDGPHAAVIARSLPGVIAD